MLAALVSERFSPALTVLAGVIVLLVAGVIDSDAAFSGFSNSAPLTVAALYVVAAAAGRTRVLENAVARFSARRAGTTVSGDRANLGRVLVPTATASAFLNNTPIVAMAIPPVINWARRAGRSPSKYLMPVRFAAVVGGTVTLIGTSTNLVVDLDVVVLIAASFGLGQAIQASGLADDLASTLIEPFGRFGDRGLLLGVLLATIIVTEMISNNAAAVLVFPVAVSTALAAGLDPRPFAIAVALGASSSFITPIGYQTNMMVYGIGGYRFTDFARLGFPLVILMIIVAMIFIPIAWPLR